MTTEQECRELAGQKGFDVRQQTVNGRWQRSAHDPITGEVFAESADWPGIDHFLSLVPSINRTPRPNVEELTRQVARDRGYKIAQTGGRIAFVDPAGTGRAVAATSAFWREALGVVLELRSIKAPDEPESQIEAPPTPPPPLAKPEQIDAPGFCDACGEEKCSRCGECASCAGPAHRACAESEVCIHCLGAGCAECLPPAA